VEENAPQEQIPPQGPVAQEQVVKVPRAFISHSENKKILNNIKHMLIEIGGLFFITTDEFFW
jgi:hypothetical protein